MTANLARLGLVVAMAMLIVVGISGTSGFGLRELSAEEASLVMGSADPFVGPKLGPHEICIATNTWTMCQFGTNRTNFCMGRCLIPPGGGPLSCLMAIPGRDCTECWLDPGYGTNFWACWPNVETTCHETGTNFPLDCGDWVQGTCPVAPAACPAGSIPNQICDYVEGCPGVIIDACDPVDIRGCT